MDNAGDANGAPIETLVYNEVDKVQGTHTVELQNGAGVQLDAAALKQEISDHYVVSLWFQATADLGGVRYLYKEGGGSNRIGLRLGGQKVEAECRARTSDGVVFKAVARSTVTIVPNVWYHAVAMFDGPAQELSVFVNGGDDKVTVETDFSSIPYHAQGATIGGPGLQTSNHTFQGLIDAVSIWRGTALSDCDSSESVMRCSCTHTLLILRFR